MAKRTTEPDPVVFRGPPRRLRLESDLPELADARFEPDEELAATLGRRRAFRAHTDRDGRLRNARARVDRSTPPGDYHARLVSGDSDVPVLFRVEPYPRLGISPGAVSFTAGEGAKPRANLVLVNKGNVDLDIPAAVTVSLCRDGGLDDAVTSALLLDSNDLDEVFGQFVERLRATHGGLLPLRFVSGSGRLGPGRRVAAVVQAEFSPRLEAGHSYHGGVALHGTSLHVAVTVTA